MRSIGIASVLALISLPLSATADETLNLKLPSTKSQAATNGPVTSAKSGAQESDNVNSAAAKANREAESFEQYLSRHQANTGRVLSSRSAGRPSRQPHAAKQYPERVVGRLGVAAHRASIRAGRGSRPILASVTGGTYIALHGESGNYFGVLMSDQSIGWIPKSDVQVLNYEVVTNQPAGLPRPPAYAPSTSDPLLNGGQKSILDEAYRYLGVPYKWGGTSPDGLDCSAFVQHCFETVGVQLPRTAHEQIECGMAVSPDQLQAADRLYFASRDGRITHTGIYIGNGYFIHSSSSHHGVAVSRLDDPLYQRMFAGARR